MTETGRLRDRRAVVTGGAGGQGRAVVSRFLDEGASIALLDVDHDQVQHALEALGCPDRVLGIVADIRDEQEVRNGIAEASRWLGGLDVLYNNAGVYWPDRDTTVDALELGVWEEVFAINATGVFLACKHSMPHLIASGRGVVINVASAAAYAGDPERHAYAASKGALLALTLSIAQRWGPSGLRAVALCPGFVATPMVDFALEDAVVRGRLEASTALRRIGTADEVASVAAFLASEDASFVTACRIDVHGGLVK